MIRIDTKMPENCWDCEFTKTDHHGLTVCAFSRKALYPAACTDLGKKRMEDCPLQEGGVPAGPEPEDAPAIWCMKVLEKVEQYIYPDGKDSGFNDHGDTRVWGFYYDREKCVQALHSNATDMHEGCYGYAVIESYREGICGSIHGSIQWFKWDSKRKGYFEIPVPDRESHTCSYCMG